MKIFSKLKSSVSYVIKIIREDLSKRMKKNSQKISVDSKKNVSEIVQKALFASPTTSSLLSGKLKDDFGLTNNIANTAVNNIIKAISENIELKIISSNNGSLVSTVIIQLLPSDIKKLVSVGGASFPSTRGQVDWLEWLLTRGSQIVVGDFWLYPKARGKTRSGGTSIMVEIGQTPRQPFRVDPAHAGTIDDNFITRALEPFYNDILIAVADSTRKNI